LNTTQATEVKDQKEVSEVYSKLSAIGQAFCADSGVKACSALVVRLIVGETKTPAWIVIRKSSATLSLTEKSVAQSAKNEVVALLSKFSTVKAEDNDKQSIELRSSEIILGRTQAELVAKTTQIIALSGAVVAREDKKMFNLAWSLDVKPEDLLNAKSEVAFKQDLQKQISEVLLVSNNQKGELGLSLKLTAVEGKTQELDFLVTRSQVALKPFTELLQNLEISHVETAAAPKSDLKLEKAVN
jgi:hypothetical protein